MWRSFCVCEVYTKNNKVRGVYANSRLCASTRDKLGRKVKPTIALASVAFCDYTNVLDHKDRNPLNNMVTNLRICSPFQNICNTSKRAGTSSKYKGVSWSNQRKVWTASIAKNKRSIYLGSYANEEDAAKSYDAAALNLFGEFANLNFPV